MQTQCYSFVTVASIVKKFGFENNHCFFLFEIVMPEMCTHLAYKRHVALGHQLEHSYYSGRVNYAEEGQ